MRPRLFLVAPILGSLIAFAYACDDDSKKDTGVSDAGKASNDSSPQNGSDGGPGGDDAGSSGNDGSTTGSEGGSGGDGGTVTVTNCTAPMRIDQRAGVAGAANPTIVAEAFGDKYVVMWNELSNVAADGMNHVLARAFDGAALGTEIDLGQYADTDTHMAADGAGHAFVQWIAAGGPTRAAFDFTTLTFTTPSVFALGASHQNNDIAGGGAGAGLSLYQMNNGNLSADLLFADGGSTSTGLSLAAQPNDLRLISNKKGQAVAGWYAGAGPTIYAVPFNGAAWSAAATTVQDGGNGGATQVYPQYTTLSNGDALTMFMHVDQIVTARFHAGTGTWDAPVTVEAMPNETQDSSARHLVVVDSADRVTIAWTRMVSAVVHAFTSRSFDQGATWSTPVDLGPASYVQLGVDAADRVVASTYGNGQNSGGGLGNEGIYLRATSATGTTWSAPVQSNVQTNQGGNYGPLAYSSRLLFDTKSHVIVVALQYQPDAGIAYTVQTVTCSL